MEKFAFERTLRIRKQVPNDLYEASELIWRTGRKVTKENLTKTCSALGIKTSRESIEDMLQICDFLDLVCPA